jgi:modulator of drug activity B
MNVFIINGHQKYSYSPGNLNAALVERAEALFKGKGFEIRKTATENAYDVAEEVEKLKWADVVFLQTPLNWMGLPWSLKKYVDEVWSAGLFGELSHGDGRSAAAPKANYGLGGVLTGRYMMSVTANAPKEAFNNPDEKFFAGMSEDDLMRMMHLNFRWIGLEPMPTFMAYDVMKNAEAEADFARFDRHLADNF